MGRYLFDIARIVAAVWLIVLVCMGENPGTSNLALALLAFVAAGLVISGILRRQELTK